MTEREHSDKHSTHAAAPQDDQGDASAADGKNRLSWKSLSLEFWGLLVAVLALFATVIIGGIQIWLEVKDVRSGVSDVGGRVERVEKGILEQRFRISSPAEEDSVDVVMAVRGETPFGELNHYIIVTPTRTGDDVVQRGPVPVYAGGLWSGQATFGAAALGTGQEFVVRCVATAATLQEGPLVEVPPDAAFSDIVTVIRR